MKVLGDNTPDEMELPPYERKIKIGTKLTMRALELTLAINSFLTETVLPAIIGVCDEDGECHLERLDLLAMSRDFVCETIREKWSREWRERKYGVNAGAQDEPMSTQQEKTK